MHGTALVCMYGSCALGSAWPVPLPTQWLAPHRCPRPGPRLAGFRGGSASAEDKADKAAAKEEEFRYQQVRTWPWALHGPPHPPARPPPSSLPYPPLSPALEYWLGVQRSRAGTYTSSHACLACRVWLWMRSNNRGVPLPPAHDQAPRLSGRANLSLPSFVFGGCRRVQPRAHLPHLACVG